MSYDNSPFLKDSSMEEEIYEQGESAEKIYIHLSGACCNSGNDLYIYSDDQCLPYVLVPHGWDSATL